MRVRAQGLWKLLQAASRCLVRRAELPRRWRCRSTLNQGFQMHVKSGFNKAVAVWRSEAHRLFSNTEAQQHQVPRLRINSVCSRTE